MPSAVTERSTRPLADRALLALLLCGLASCAGADETGLNAARGGAPPVLQGAAASAPAHFQLPAPAALERLLPRPRSAAYVEADLFRSGSAYQNLLPFANLDPLSQAPDCVFNPAAVTPNGMAGVAFGIYDFTISGFDRNALIRYDISSAGASYNDIFIGLSDWDKGTWSWFGGDPSGRLELPSLDPYFNPAGRILVVVLSIGNTPFSLAELRVGGRPPEANLTATEDQGLLPLSVSFDALLSIDPDASDLSFEWDWEGDGTYDLSTDSSGAFQEHVYEFPGVFSPRVRVTDAEGLQDSASVELNIYDFWTHTIGGDSYERLLDMVTDTTNSCIYVAGYMASEPFSVESRDVMLAKYSFAGELLWAYSAGMAASQEAKALVRDSASGDIFLAGEGDDADGNDYDGLLQRWGPDGTLKWTRYYGGSLGDVFRDILVLDGNIYVVGSTSSFGAGGTDAWAASFDLNGNNLWSKVWGSAAEDSLRAMGGRGFLNPSGIVCAGSTRISDATGDVLLLDFNLDGALARADSWGTNGNIENAVQVSRSVLGDTVLLGQTYSSGSDNAFFASFDSDFNTNFSRLLGMSGADDNPTSYFFANNKYTICGHSHYGGPERIFLWEVDPADWPSALAEHGHFPGGSDTEGHRSLGFPPGGGILISGSGGSASPAWSKGELSHNSDKAGSWTSRSTTTANAGASLTSHDWSTIDLSVAVIDSGGGFEDSLVTLRGPVQALEF
jgi:PKD repeat protein